jgi:5-methylcytosine-specific restriction endonuclease McrA
MMPVPCLVCGRRVVGGGSRCAEHSGRKHRLPTACVTCGRPSNGNYCEEHEPTEEDRLKAQPFRIGYRDPNYHREKQAAKTRANGACEKCGRTDLKLECDHIIPLKDGGKNERGNLWMLCTMCHRRKTSQDRQRRKP